jgi:hypothetical protein
MGYGGLELFSGIKTGIISHDFGRDETETGVNKWPQIITAIITA